LIHHQRYAHAMQFDHADQALRTFRTQLGLIRDIGCIIGQDARMSEIFEWLSSASSAVPEKR
jgi:hypothetical protein